jgi:hypothetical protein
LLPQHVHRADCRRRLLEASPTHLMISGARAIGPLCRQCTFVKRWPAAPRDAAHSRSLPVGCDAAQRFYPQRYGAWACGRCHVDSDRASVRTNRLAQFSRLLAQAPCHEKRGLGGDPQEAASMARWPLGARHNRPWWRNPFGRRDGVAPPGVSALPITSETSKLKRRVRNVVR